MGQETVENATDTLNGWKEIALYVGKSVRSVQRWEHELGLPVRRITTPDHGQIVYASRSEMDAWRHQMEGAAAAHDDSHAADVVRTGMALSTEPGLDASVPIAAPVPGRRVLPLVVVGPLLVVAVGVGMLLGLAWKRAIPVEADHIRLAGHEVEALSPGGEIAWSYTFDGVVTAPSTATDPGERQTDLNHDGKGDFLVPLRRGPRSSRQPSVSDLVAAFSHDGRLLWTVQPDREFTLGARHFSGPWHYSAMAVATDGHVWMAFHHNTWSPSYVLDVDPTGAAHLLYAQSGWITSLVEWNTEHRRLMLVGGVDNVFQQTSLVAVDLDDAPTQLPAALGGGLVCADCPTEPPHALWLFPESEITKATSAPYSLIAQLVALPGSLKVSFQDRRVAFLGPALELDSIVFADSYWTLHRQLEAEGKLTHPADLCPAASGVAEVRTWIDGVWTARSVRLVREPVVNAG
jgi:hypothetical protein